MREIHKSGSMSGERKRDDGRTAPKSPRLSSTLLERHQGVLTPVHSASKTRVNALMAGYARDPTSAGSCETLGLAKGSTQPTAHPTYGAEAPSRLLHATRESLRCARRIAPAWHAREFLTGY